MLEITIIYYIIIYYFLQPWKNNCRGKCLLDCIDIKFKYINKAKNIDYIFLLKPLKLIFYLYF